MTEDVYEKLAEMTRVPLETVQEEIEKMMLESDKPLQWCVGRYKALHSMNIQNPAEDFIGVMLVWKAEARKYTKSDGESGQSQDVAFIRVNDGSFYFSTLFGERVEKWEKWDIGDVFNLTARKGANNNIGIVDYEHVSHLGAEDITETLISAIKEPFLQDAIEHMEDYLNEDGFNDRLMFGGMVGKVIKSRDRDAVIGYTIVGTDLDAGVYDIFFKKWTKRQSLLNINEEDVVDSSNGAIVIGKPNLWKGKLTLSADYVLVF